MYIRTRLFSGVRNIAILTAVFYILCQRTTFPSARSKSAHQIEKLRRIALKIYVEPCNGNPRARISIHFNESASNHQVKISLRIRRTMRRRRPAYVPPDTRSACPTTVTTNPLAKFIRYAWVSKRASFPGFSHVRDRTALPPVVRRMIDAKRQPNIFGVIGYASTAACRRWRARIRRSQCRSRVAAVERDGGRNSSCRNEMAA